MPQHLTPRDPGGFLPICVFKNKTSVRDVDPRESVNLPHPYSPQLEKKPREPQTLADTHRQGRICRSLVCPKGDSSMPLEQDRDEFRHWGKNLPELFPSPGLHCTAKLFGSGSNNLPKGRGRKQKAMSDYPASRVMWVVGKETSISSSTQISEEGPPWPGEGKRKGRKHTRISKGIKGTWFLPSASALQ